MSRPLYPLGHSSKVGRVGPAKYSRAFNCRCVRFGELEQVGRVGRGDVFGRGESTANQHLRVTR